MKHTLVRLIGLLIAVMLVLTGCNLIEVDPIMQLDEDLAAAKKQFSGVVVNYDGGEITQEEVMTDLASQYNSMAQLYSAYGMSMTSEVVNNLQQYVLENAVQNVAVSKQLEERGLALDDAALEEINGEVDENYKSLYDSMYAQADGATDEVKAKQTEYALYRNGYTREGLYNAELASHKYELLRDDVQGEITEVTDEELSAAYEEKVSEDEDRYSASASSFESAMTNGTTVYWIPEGYRTVKHILAIPEEDVLNAFKDARSACETAQSDLEGFEEELEALNADDAEDSGEEPAEEPTEEPRTEEAIQADIDKTTAELEAAEQTLAEAEQACLENVKAKTDEIYEKIAAGEDFDALIEEYGEDPGMQNEPSKTAGYYVSADSAKWDARFTAGAMALEQVGDVSAEPVVSSSGVHIIRYESDVTGGAVALDEVHDALYEDTLSSMKTEHFNSELQSWVDALNPVYHMEGFDLN